MSQEFRLKHLDETRNYLLKELQQNELISKKHKFFWTTLNYFEHYFILASTIIGCISYFAFASSLVIPTEITSSAIGLKICAIAAGTKKCKSMIKKKKKRHNKTVLVAKSKLNNIKMLISKALTN